MGFRDRVLGCSVRPRDGARRHHRRARPGPPEAAKAAAPPPPQPLREPAGPQPADRPRQQAAAEAEAEAEEERPADQRRPLVEEAEEQEEERPAREAAEEEEEGAEAAERPEAAEALAAPGAALRPAGATASEDEVRDDSPEVRALLQLLEPGQPLAGLSDFAKEYADAAFCRRLLRKFNGDVRKCRPRFIEALQWREKNEELLTKRKFVQAGDLRVIGRDSSGHPMVYLCMKNQWLSNTQGMDQLTVRTVEAIEAMPPGVEKATHIWDLHGLQLRLNWNPTPLVHMVQALEGYFAERCHQVIIIDMPGVASAIKDAVWPLVPAKTKEKILFLTPKAAEEHMRKVCDEETAGRLIATMARDRDASLTLEDRKKTWTQVNKLGELLPAFP